MTARLDDGRESILTKVPGGWTVWPDPKAKEQKKFTIVAVKVGWTWSKLGKPITFEAGETVPFYM